MISAAQGLEMEDQTIQQALILLKIVVSLRKSPAATSPNLQDKDGAKVTPLFEMTSNGLVCLMLASKVQDSDMHLKVANVVQLLRKFIDDNPG